MTVAEQTALRAEWVALVTQVCADVEMWCQARQWWVHREAKRLEEETLGEYEVPRLVIQTPQARLHVEPLGRDTIGAQGRIAILAYPSMNSLLLLRRNGRWELYTEARVKWPVGWGQDGFYGLVEALTAP